MPKFCNVNINITSKQELFQRTSERAKCIVTVNAQIIVLANENQKLLEFINTNHATMDGEVPLKVARILSTEFRDVMKLSGSDIVYDFCNYAKKNNLKVFFLGGREDSVKGAIGNIEKKYGVSVDGFSPDFEEYPFSEYFIDTCKSHIKEFSPDILFVGFGAGKQEYFIEDNQKFMDDCKVQYVIASGGTVDFVSGKIKRAPKWVSQTGLEGFYRFFQEISFARAKRILISFQFLKYIN